MTASAKRKKEKKKDFQKQKLKVGKTKAKADNFTDTTFASRSIALKKQFAHIPAASSTSPASNTAAQITQHVSRLRNRTDSTRAESLAYLTNLPDTTLDAHAQQILPKLPALIHDLSPAVRAQLPKLLRRFAPPRVAAHHELLLTWTRAGVTHLSRDVRATALDVLEWLVGVAGAEVVGCRGGWVVTLRAFMTTLGWSEAAAPAAAAARGGWSASRTVNARIGVDAKLHARILHALAAFVAAGIAPPDGRAVAAARVAQPSGFPFAGLREHLVPERHGAFAHLNLSGQVRDERDIMLEDRRDRQDAFEKEFVDIMNKGLSESRKEGGEVGRSAAALRKAIDAGLL